MLIEKVEGWYEVRSLVRETGRNARNIALHANPCHRLWSFLAFPRKVSSLMHGCLIPTAKTELFSKMTCRLQFHTRETCNVDLSRLYEAIYTEPHWRLAPNSCSLQEHTHTYSMWQSFLSSKLHYICSAGEAHSRFIRLQKQS